jgi:hypothetical protein
MICQTAGKIVQQLDQTYGKTKSGKDFERRDYLLELFGGTQYVHSIKFTMYSFDGPIQNPIEVGQHVKVSLKIIASQFNGKWYNDVSLVSWEPA